MNKAEIDKLLEDAEMKHGIKVDKNDPNIRSLVRLISHRMYAQCFEDMKKDFKLK